ncbi:MAG: adenylate kinase [Acidimicrobiia bacterium]|nr:adenylate kinase [Acidimicrobiia bacterium]
MPQRISIRGCSGSGKSTLGGELSRLLNLPYHELDAIMHGPDWKPTPEEEMKALVAEIAAGDRWIIDGNYRFVQPIITKRVDLVVALDLPRYLIMSRLVWRTLSRIATREELWNGNTEQWRNLFNTDPEENIILWGWTQHPQHRKQIDALVRESAHGGPPVVRLTSRDQVRHFVQSLETGVRP